MRDGRIQTIIILRPNLIQIVFSVIWTIHVLNN